jgi:hypothetical protein
VLGVGNPYTSLCWHSLARHAARRGRTDQAVAWRLEAMDQGLDPGSASKLGTQPDFAELARR